MCDRAVGKERRSRGAKKESGPGGPRSLALYPDDLMVQCETMNVGLGRTSLVVAASDGPGG